MSTNHYIDFEWELVGDLTGCDVPPYIFGHQIDPHTQGGGGGWMELGVSVYVSICIHCVFASIHMNGSPVKVGLCKLEMVVLVDRETLSERALVCMYILRYVHSYRL